MVEDYVFGRIAARSSYPFTDYKTNNLYRAGKVRYGLNKYELIRRVVSLELSTSKIGVTSRGPRNPTLPNCLQRP